MKDLTQLVRGCADGDPICQKKLYEQYQSTILAICWRYTGNRDEAYDVFQDTFVKIFQRIGQLKEPGALEGWMRKIAVNNSLNHVTARAKNRTEELEWERGPSANDHDHLQYEDLMNLVQQLPTQYRLVFNLSVIEGYSFEEISQELNISESTCRSNLHRARHWLQDKLGKQ